MIWLRIGWLSIPFKALTISNTIFFIQFLLSYAHCAFSFHRQKQSNGKKAWKPIKICVTRKLTNYNFPRVSYNRSERYACYFVCKMDREPREVSMKRSDWFHIWNAFKLCGHNATYNLCVIIGIAISQKHFNSVNLRLCVCVCVCVASVSVMHPSWRGWYAWMFRIFCLRWGIIKFGYEHYIFHTLLNNSAYTFEHNAESLW